MGADFSLLLGAYNKRMTENRDKSKIRDDFSLNPFRADGWVAVGTERLMVYARYGLSPMFKSNSGPDLRNISVGLVLAGN